MLFTNYGKKKIFPVSSLGIVPSLAQSAYVISVKWGKIFPKSGLEVWYELYRGIEYINFVAAFVVKVHAAGSMAVS